jgi:6-pyruvoyltetrahydropterin/6-carboxytetrahydropterin synthase
MSVIYITRRENFNAAHRLFNPEWSDEKNLEVFGKCANPNWHGHNYILYVTVKGEPKAETGLLMDLRALSNLIKSIVIEKIDHRNMNLDVDFMKGKMASTENLAKAIWDQIHDEIKKEGADLHCVKLVETENNSVEYYG